MADWQGPDGELGRHIEQQAGTCLDVYAKDPLRIEEDARIETTTAEGGYHQKQLFELVQNAADAVRGTDAGRIHVVLTQHALYVANTGSPFTVSGIQSLLASHISRKSGEEIGQFGLGFKSVTAIADKVAILSRSGSFLLDREWSKDRIQARGLHSPSYPMLRLARVVDPVLEAHHDPVLAQFLPWSTTVIRVTLKSGRPRLAEEIAEFPAQFLLFSPDIAEMHLDDREAGQHRTFRRSYGAGEVTILDNQVASRWIVATKAHNVSPAALRDQGELVQRPTVVVSWALQSEGAHGLGEFWAHFPTDIRCTLSGIINAPWKLNPDRTAMISGPYNEELLTEVLPSLVASGISRISDATDPAAALDVLPARGRESRSWADGCINAPIFTTLAKCRCLPDQNGELRRPSELHLHPSGMPQAWRDLWSSAAPQSWVHGSVDGTPERRSKAERLMEVGGGSRVTLVPWLEAVPAGRGTAGSAEALKLAAAMVGFNRDYAKDVAEAKIVLLEDGVLGRPIRGRVFIHEGGASNDHTFIDHQLAEIPGVRESLAALGIEVLNPAGELRAALQTGPNGPGWSRIWALARRLDPETAYLVFREELPAPLTKSVIARMRSGKWRPLDMCFLAGEVIPGDGHRDADSLIDPSFHAPDESLLERCGAVSSPRLIANVPDEPWLVAYKSNVAEKYCERVRGQKQLSPDRVQVSGPSIPWPLELMSSLSPEGRAAMTRKVLDYATNEPWKAQYATSGNFAVQKAPGPAVVRIKDHGFLPTTVGPAEPRICLHPDSSLPDCLPKAQVSTQWAAQLQLPMDCADWDPDVWSLFCRDAEARRPDTVTTVYLEAVRHRVPAPERIQANRSASSRLRVPPSDVAVTDVDEVYTSLLMAGITSLLVEAAKDRDDLVARWGLADGRGMLREETIAHPDAEPDLLIDRFPPLRVYGSEIPDLDHLLIQTCDSIELLVSTPKGQESRPATSHREDNLLHVLNGSDYLLLQRLGQVLGVRINEGLVLNQMQERARNKLRLEIEAEEDLGRKLVLAVGADALREKLPSTAIRDLELSRRTLEPEELAQLVLSVHGYHTLKELKAELAEKGLEPPQRWAGSREARRFVEGLGFPAEYAGLPEASRSPEIEVEGRVELAKLHDFQSLVVDRIKDLFTLTGSERRGMVTLPTGAGKTRVAVQAVVDLVGHGSLRGPIVWIAQSDELCEQAVQAWAYVWRAMGTGPMSIARFWSGNRVAEAGVGTFQVVVATIDKLREAIGKSEYDWLRNPSLIIVDEAHTSIAPTYTRVFQWLGGEALTTRMEVPLLGLTATAYRGVNEEETRRLIDRYGRNKLDADVFGTQDPYLFLQRERVLAKVRQDLLNGIDIPWTESMAQHLDTFGTLPREVEGLVGQNSERNRVILESVLNQPKDWTVLFFATSVEHARAMAAELSYYDVPSRPIDASTEPALRRRYIEDFRHGEIRVLTNYGVLSQGFDAPKVRAVYVTRPTFSPNVYQQMIGRGLRGPLNGGSDEVLIVNVADNLAQFGRELAFHHFDHLWEPAH
jgi:superfamily II DNA or RNA helicase